MPRYSVEASVSLVAADTAIAVVAEATSRPRIYDIQMSGSGTPADYSAHFDFKRFDGTGAGTSTAITPSPLDAADPAALSDGAHTFTAEPTTAGAVVLNIAHNMRASPRWVAAPGSELVIPATNDAMIGALCVAVSTQFTEEFTIFFWE